MSSRRKIITLHHLTMTATIARQHAETIVLTNGCFDLLHAGHLATIEFARAQGDILVVAINTDESVRELKGPPRPIVPYAERTALVAALEAVSYVIPLHGPDLCEILCSLRPEVLVKGGSTEQIIGHEFVENYGGRVLRGPLACGVSTTIRSNVIGAM